jgi:hypothetical protein
MDQPFTDKHRIIILWAFAKLDVPAVIAASGAVLAVMLFAVTLLLVVKGAPPGVPIGPHLAKLDVYFPGYSVTVMGAFIGGAYAGLLGSGCGLVLASAWNLAHRLVLAVIRIRARLASYSLD